MHGIIRIMYGARHETAVAFPLVVVRPEVFPNATYDLYVRPTGTREITNTTYVSHIRTLNQKQQREVGDYTYNRHTHHTPIRSDMPL